MEEKQAQQLLILGNGFDLHCDLKSSYQDFMTHIVNKFSHEDETGSDKDIFDKFIEKLNSDTIDEKLNLWYLIFLHEQSITNWFDIENTISKYIQYSSRDWTITNSLEQFTKEYIKYMLKSDNNSINHPLHNILIKQLEKYDRNNIEETFLDLTSDHKNQIIDCDNHLEKFLRKHNSTVFKDRNDIEKNSVHFEIEKIIDDAANKSCRQLTNSKLHSTLLYELKNLELDFQNYLNDLTKGNTQYISSANNTIKQMLSKNPEYPNFIIFSFNYTTPEIEIDSQNLIDRKNVHGYSNTHSNESNIIFGVDALNYKTSHGEYRFTKEYRTLELYMKKNHVDLQKNIFSKSIKVIKFYGHSLSEADWGYFQYIFDLYKLYDSDIQLIFFFSTFGDKTEEELFKEQLELVTKLIERYGENLDNKAQGKNLLTRLIQTNRLVIMKI